MVYGQVAVNRWFCVGFQENSYKNKYLTLYPIQGDLMANCAINIYPWQNSYNYLLTTTVIQINPITNIIREGVIIVGASRKEIK